MTDQAVTRGGSPVGRGAAGTGSLRLRARTREAVGFYLCILPWIIGFLAFTAGPMLYSLYLSLTRYDILSAPRWVGLDNFTRLFGDDLFWQSLKVTGYYSFGAVPLRLLFGLFLAVLLNQRIVARAFFRTLFYLPAVMSGVAVSLLWLWVFNPEFGVINYLLGFVGIEGPKWIYSEDWAVPSLILMSIWDAGAIMIIFLAGLQGVPDSLYDAAEVDGANSVQKFWNVTLPMLSPVLLFNLVIGVINSFQVFTQAYIMTQGGPHNATYFMVLYIYNSAFSDLRMGFASALAWILFLITLVFTLLIFRSTPFWVYYESEMGGGKAKVAKSKGGV